MSRFVALLSFVGAASAQICDALDPYVPTELGCFCTDSSSASTLECELDILSGEWSVGARAIIDLCGSDPDISFYLDYGSGYQLLDTWGYASAAQMIPIPDLSYSVFGYSVGAEAEITFSGTLSDTSINLGIGACVGSDCDSDIP